MVVIVSTLVAPMAWRAWRGVAARSLTFRKNSHQGSDQLNTQRFSCIMVLTMTCLLHLLLFFLVVITQVASYSITKCNNSTCSMASEKEEIAVAFKYQQDGDEARQIAKHVPYFPFKGIPRFYDIGGFLAEPEIFQQIVNIFVDRYREIGIDSIAG